MKRKNLIILLLIAISIMCYINIVKGLKLFIVESGSMEPTLQIGEIVIVKKKNTYKDGDIITFYDNKFNGYVTHRIIGKNEKENFITKGDYNNSKDEADVSINDIVGKVVFHSKILGFLLYKYKNVTIILLIAILILSNVYSIIFRERN